MKRQITGGSGTGEWRLLMLRLMRQSDESTSTFRSESENKNRGWWIWESNQLFTETTEQRGRHRRRKMERRRVLRTDCASDSNSPFPVRKGEQSWGGTSREVYLPTGTEGVASLHMPVPLKHTSLPSSLDCQLWRSGDNTMYFNLNAYSSTR